MNFVPRVLLACLLFAATLSSAPLSPAHAIQCVPYAREVSGVEIKGNAWQWWHAAAGSYDRGAQAKGGAILVFSRQGSMRHGHVAVVSKVVHSRLILVDHANWAPAGSSGRGKVDQAVPVLDVSAKNDWSKVRVWHGPAQDFGTRIYAAEGFIYNKDKAPRSAAKPGLESAALQKAAILLPGDKSLARKAAPQPATAVKPASAPALISAPISTHAAASKPAPDIFFFN